jgi:hypothetical protein
LRKFIESLCHLLKEGAKRWVKAMPVPGMMASGGYFGAIWVGFTLWRNHNLYDFWTYHR